MSRHSENAHLSHALSVSNGTELASLAASRSESTANKQWIELLTWVMFGRRAPYKIQKSHSYLKGGAMSPVKSIVFCHGIWADGSCFSKLIPALRVEGYEVITAEYGLDSHRGDVDCILRTLGRVASPILLVGHSYGGATITVAGTDDRVAGLVYIAAVAPDEEETTQSQLSNFPLTEVFGQVEVADDRNWMRPTGVQYFAGDLSEEEQQVVWATAMAPVHDLFDQKCEGVAWRSKPSWYVVSNNDQTVHPDLQRFVSKRMEATVTDVDSSHVSMLSHPDVVLDVIKEAAEKC
jgi:pimeloyl-ACP methyl ester carboxylesterase